MSEFRIGMAQRADFESILALQTQNHVSQLAEEVLAEGFVTTQLTPEVLESMRLNAGIWVARASNGELAAYACANDWAFYGEGPFHRAVRALLPLDWDGRRIDLNNSFQYGPVCLAPSFRGQGLLPAIVENIRKHFAPRFEFGITFIDSRNMRSLAAHERKLGFRQLALLPFEDVVYHLLAFETRQ